MINLFQFHKVQLKGSAEEEDITFDGFQFHKVQLKESSFSDCYYGIVVSIP